ncbi:MAG: major facilitator superfamily 1, partial [Candidatus Solibacter sp.]|nr:major facilitator superfamily 1 [Candidatus Solibacter sp.]
FFVVLGLASIFWLVPWCLQGGGGGGQAATEVGPTTLEILSKRSAWGAFFGHFCGNYFWYFLLTWLPTYFVNERGFSNAAMLRITSVSFFLIAAATVCAGWFSDRWIARGGSPTRVRKTVVAVGLTGSTIILPVAIVTNPMVAQALLLIACMSFGIYVSNHWAITQTLAGPLAAGRWTSLQNGVGNLSGIAGSWLTGMAVDQTKSFVLPFAIAGAIALTGAVLWVFVVGPVRQVEWKEGRA